MQNIAYEQCNVVEPKYIEVAQHNIDPKSTPQ